MKIMFSGLKKVKLEIDGVTREVPEGISVAAAVMLDECSCIRTTPLSGEERAPYCFMGVCFECLVEIDGVPNRQGCIVPVAEGMKIRRQLQEKAVTELEEHAR